MLSLILVATLAQSPPPVFCWTEPRVAIFYGIEHRTLPRERGLKCYQRAAQQWADACRLQIWFVNRIEDSNVCALCRKIDGKGKWLAWSCYPRNPRAYQWFDEDDDLGKFSDDDLTSLFTHELGHSLGLEHSEDEKDIMYKTLRQDFWKLSEKDTQRIVALYGK